VKKIFIILICLLIANTAFAGFRSPLKVMKQKYGIHKDAELIKIQSYYADDYLEIKEGRYKDRPVKVDALIHYPKGEGPFPVLIIAHSSGGPSEIMDKWYNRDLFEQDQDGVWHPKFKVGTGLVNNNT